MKNFIIPFNDTYELGKGISSLTAEAKGTIFTDFEIEENIAATGQKVEASLIKIDSVEKLYESLDIDVEVSASYGLASVDAKFSYASESNFNSHSIYYLYKVRVQNAVKRIKKLQYDPFAIQLLKDGKTEAFNRKYGDSYIEAIKTGGEFFALYELQCQDETSKQKISAELDMSYGAGFASVDVNAKFNHSLQKVSNKTTLTIKIFQTGGKGNDLVFTPDAINDRATKFPSIVQGDAGVPYEIIRASYETLPLPEGPNYIELETRKEILNSYAKDIIDLRRKQNDLKYILLNPWEFEFKSRESNKELGTEDINFISKNLGLIQNYIKEYTKHAVQCADSVSACEGFTYSGEMFDLSHLPTRKERFVNVILFDEKNFTGNAYYLTRGRYPTPEAMGSLANDTISSIKLPLGFKAYLYEHANYQGKNYPLDASTADLTENNGLDNTISSMIIFDDTETKLPRINEPVEETVGPPPVEPVHGLFLEKSIRPMDLNVLRFTKVIN